MSIRRLPKGAPVAAQIHSFESHLVRVELPTEEAFPLEQPVELSDETAVYLGIVQQIEPSPGGHLAWVVLEHRLDLRRLAELQTEWGSRDQTPTTITTAKNP